ncbi:hypothetical protein V1290_004409 [Bradyrhizobium sp. AZCC 1578]|uniref:DUF6731 family protein n=1 Tax=Bradyrhizobium sp. AZCC 1578 TaxID=3117027 RepID=UPI002FF04883
MDQGIAIRFYRVERAERHDPTFAKTLEKIFALGGPSKRMKDVNGVKVRLEAFDARSAGFYEGEFVRLQERGYPSEVHDEHTLALQTERPLGHHLAFVFNENKSVLAAQYDSRTLSLSRVNGYLNSFPPHVWYLFTPLVRKDMWNRFISTPPKKIRFAIANPTDLNQVTGAHKAVYQNIAELAESYSPHLMEVSMSMGQSKGALTKAHEFAKDLLRRNDNGEIDLRKLKGKGAEQEEEIDLLGEVLTEKITLDLPRNDPKESYKIRLEALHASMARNDGKF